MAHTLARLFLAPIFFFDGLRLFRHPEEHAPKAGAAGIPEPELAVKVDGAAMALGGIALGLGIRPRLAAALLIVAFIPTTLVFHAFWKEETEDGRKHHQTHFVKNLGLIGGLLLVMSGEKKKPREKEA